MPALTPALSPRRGRKMRRHEARSGRGFSTGSGTVRLRGDVETFIKTMLSCLPKGLPYSSDRTAPPPPTTGLAYNRSSLISLRRGTNAIVPLHLAPVCVGRRDDDEGTGRGKMGVA